MGNGVIRRRNGIVSVVGENGILGGGSCENSFSCIDKNYRIGVVERIIEWKKNRGDSGRDIQASVKEIFSDRKY